MRNHGCRSACIHAPLNSAVRRRKTVPVEICLTVISKGAPSGHSLSGEYLTCFREQEAGSEGLK
jgi:hypothetical protein